MRGTLILDFFFSAGYSNLQTNIAAVDVMDTDARTRVEVSEGVLPQPKLPNIMLTAMVLVFPPSVKPISDRQYFQVSNLGRILCKIWPSTRYVLGFLSRQPSQVQIVGNLYVWVSKASFDSEWSDSLSASHFLHPHASHGNYQLIFIPLSLMGSV